MSKNVVAALIIIGIATTIVHGQNKRQVGGIIYFSNNTPNNVLTVSVEVLKSGKRVAVTYPDGHFRFAFANLRPGRYLLRLTWPKHCVLSYRLDLSKQSIDLVKVVMDAECAHNNGKILEVPPN